LRALPAGREGPPSRPRSGRWQRRRTLTPEEVGHLLAEHRPFYATTISSQVGTGLRSGELPPGRPRSGPDRGHREALHAVADWIKTFVVKPHKDLGRAGTICPFVPGSLERKTLWLAPEQIADRDVPEVVELINGYQRLFLDTRPTDGDDVIYNVIVVVFSDLPADRAQEELRRLPWRTTA
jgi:hypothetical protein